MKKSVLLLLIMGFSILYSQEIPNTPTNTVKRIHALLKQYDENSPNNKKIKDEVNSYFDLLGMAQRAIIDHWNKMTKKQQDEYISLMFKLLEKAVYKDTQENLQKGVVKYKAERKIGKRAAVVTDIYIKTEDMTIENEFRMRNNSEKWVVEDILIDGASLTEDYRSQFNKIISQYGIDKNKDSLFPRIRKAISEDKDEWRKNWKAKREKPKKQTRPTLLEK